MKKICSNCGKPARYELTNKLICFSCICKIERESSVESIIKQAEFITGVSYIKMKSRARERDIVDAKYYAMYLLREEGAGSFSFIGDLFGVNHATVIHGINKIKGLIQFKQLPYA